jgi:aryl-phospho-beta-D-glucosidase BglC (GH1 family)
VNFKMNRKRFFILPVLLGGLALGSLVVGCGGGGGGDTGGGPGGGTGPNPPSISAVNSTDASFQAPVTPRMNQRAYYQVTGSSLPSTLSLTVADCTSMTTVSISSTEARFHCMPSHTEGTKPITVKDSSGDTTLYSASIAVLAATSPLPMPTYGFNLGNSLEAVWGYAYPGPAVYTEAAKAGFNAVRIPCAWDSNADDDTYQINPAYMAKVKEAVDGSIAAGMHAVINIHWDGGWMENNIGSSVDPVIDAKMRSYWTQIATAFAGYDNRLLFAAANEPNVHNLAEMTTLVAYYQTFVDAVRAVGGKNTDRWLVLQGGGDTSWFTTLPDDPTPGRLMVEFHNYTPSLFTIIHEDQSWGNAIWFWGAAYHYPGNHPRNATFGEEGAIDSGYQQLKEQFVDKGVPVLIGEFHAAGTAGLTGDEQAYNRASVLYWNKYALDSAQAHGLSPFYWSTPNAPFNYSTGTISDPELVAALTGGIVPSPLNGAPQAVTGLVATAAGTGQVSLSWNAVAGATSYSLYRTSRSGYEPATPSVTGITGTSYNDTGLNDGTTYYYQVVAVNGSGPSGFSTEAYATTPGVNPDPAKFSFETDTQPWSASGDQIAGLATSTAQHHAGKQSMAVSFIGTAAGQSSLDLSGAVVPAGATVSFRVWLPAGHQVTSIEAYLQDYHWGWAASWYGSFTAGAWNTLTITVPPDATTPLQRLGLRISTGAAWSGTLYVDSIDWSMP